MFANVSEIIYSESSPVLQIRPYRTFSLENITDI